MSNNILIPILFEISFDNIVTIPNRGEGFLSGLWVIISCIILYHMILFWIYSQLIRKFNQNEETSTHNTDNEDIYKMFNNIRSQRHDFLNHVMVIKGLLDKEEYEQAQNYMMELIGEISLTNDIINIGNLVLSSLIQTKISIAKKRNIRFSHQFLNMDRLEFGFRATDYVKILGNLIDNALEEAGNKSGDDRWIEVQGRVAHGKLFLMVKNKGTLEDTNLVFKPGYSKKKGEHSGLGLAIVNESVAEYSGAVMVSQVEDCILFEVMLPLPVEMKRKVEKVGE
ncbi:sensor histidine kinase [Paenibacillus sp. Leaf72]|uniref:sensor histidine kinase n=1 Tax=Paenibacillus sp. Leaf72 TaxID=1736234 RepID=UPI0006F8E168|nr:GHKL domain-containing protein [Paenibacillus sp. Leaf72]KQN96963.1 hypothetical protein ASF12_23115 [Paenibacillus sp. Leaf72]